MQPTPGRQLNTGGQGYGPVPGGEPGREETT